MFTSRRRHTRCGRDWSSDVCSSDLSEESTSWLEAVAYFSQKLFIYKRLTEICDGLQPGGRFLGRWKSKSSAVKELAGWLNRSEERRVGKECRSRWSPDH